MPPPFAERLLAWFDQHGRHDLPWQHPRTPYRVWVAEIMLQQTQVSTVLPYYTRFMARFADVETLAAADPDAVLALWSGLGYYARARNLHRAAKCVAAAGAFPLTLDGWLALPGIGRSTAAAILAQAYGQRHAILDGNVRRLLARHAGIDGWPGQPAVAAQLWAVAQSLLPSVRLADYTQAQMDLGATVCTARAPRCTQCPLAEDCVARRDGRIAGLPAPRPRRERPQRSTTVLLVAAGDGRWLLERRPPAGIWGGLWCAPLADTAEAGRALLAQRYGVDVDVDAGMALPPLAHAFTHFDLEMQPLRLAAAALAPTALEAPARWLTMDELLALGLPAPLRRLYTHLQQEGCECPAPYTASNSTPTPKASTGRRIRARSASASSSTSASAPGRIGSPTRRG